MINEITKYYQPKYPITIFDIQGLEGEGTVKKVINLNKNFDKNINESRDPFKSIRKYLPSYPDKGG